jgi:hypothetical protein
MMLRREHFQTVYPKKDATKIGRPIKLPTRIFVDLVIYAKMSRREHFQTVYPKKDATKIGRPIKLPTRIFVDLVSTLVLILLSLTNLTKPG